MQPRQRFGLFPLVSLLLPNNNKCLEILLPIVHISLLPWIYLAQTGSLFFLSNFQYFNPPLLGFFEELKKALEPRAAKKIAEIMGRLYRELS